MREIKFKDFIKLNRGFDLPNDKMVMGDFPVVASTSIKGYHDEYKVLPPVVVTGRSGSLGSVQYIEKACTPLNTTLYVKDFKGNDPKYVYYYLKMMHLESFNSGAGVPTLNQNHLHGLKLKIHELQKQKKVANVLSEYDDLLEANNRRIELLEQSAQELYKEWFVRFRFPGYESIKFENGIPEDWNVSKLSQISDFVYGKMPQQEHVVENGFPIFSGYRVSGYYDSFMFEEPMLVLIARGVGGTGEVKISPPCAHITNLAIVFKLNNPDLHKRYLYHMFTLQNLRYLDTGAAQSQITIENLKNVKVILPTDGLLEKFNKIIAPFYEEQDRLKSINENLINQRDLLLPRLISGKLEVN